SRTIARIFQRCPHGQDAASSAVVVLWRPVFGLAASPCPGSDGAERDLVVADKRVRLQALAQRRKVGHGLDGRARLACRLCRAMELAQSMGKPAGHRQNTTGLVLQDHRRPLNLRAYPQLRAPRRFALASRKMNQDHIMNLELALY